MTDSSQKSKGDKKEKRLYPRVLLSLGATLLALAGAEIVLHIVGYPQFLAPHSEPTRFAFTNGDTASGPLYLNMPGRITFQYDGNPRGYFDADNEVHHDVNPSGFRGPAFRPKPEGTRHLVFLGDSFTFGEGVHNQDTYPEVAARLLREDGQNVLACNLGVGGYNTSQAAEVLRLFGFDLQPDVVVLGYTLNDAEPPLFQVDPKNGQPVRRAREAFIESEGELGTPPDSLLYRLRLTQAIWQVRRQRELSRQTIEYYLSLHSSSNKGRVESERALREIIEACKDRKIPCVVVMFPLLYNLSDDYPFAHVHAQIGEVVRQAGGNFIDLLPALKGQRASDLIVHPTDQHPNEIVHELAGRMVAEEIGRLMDSAQQP
jgi:lysophospholipase L1-like esterase